MTGQVEVCPVWHLNIYEGTHMIGRSFEVISSINWPLARELACLIFSSHCFPHALASTWGTWIYLIVLRSLAPRLTPGLEQLSKVSAQEKHAELHQVEIQRPKNNGLCSIHHKICIWHVSHLICGAKIPFSAKLPSWPSLVASWTFRFSW